MNFLFNVANTAMKFLSNPMLGVNDDTAASTENKKTVLPYDQWGWVTSIEDAVNQLLLPLLVLVGTAGVIYAIVLGVNLARADSADKQKEAKQRMVTALIALACIAGGILLIKLLVSYLPGWLGYEIQAKPA